VDQPFEIAVKKDVLYIRLLTVGIISERNHDVTPRQPSMLV
jgi:hypothetical protein